MNRAGLLLGLLAVFVAIPALAETGVASVDYGRPTRWDGGRYAGLVATGERYKAAALAVAHKTLPLNSCIAVRFNDKVVTATVKDRGPCLSDFCQATAPRRVRERVLDMTPLLASRLHFPGLGRVSFWPVACI